MSAPLSPGWHVHEIASDSYLRFELRGPCPEGMPKSVTYGAFAFRSHAETALRALAADPANAAPGASAQSDTLLDVAKAFVVELDSGGDFENWQSVKARLRKAVAAAEGLPQ